MSEQLFDILAICLAVFALWLGWYSFKKLANYDGSEFKDISE
jgi:hypothetical protein